MKKQMIILAAVVTPLAFFSCSKEKIETQQPNDSEPISGLAFKPIIKPVVDLTKGLSAMYQFDGNLTDNTGQLKDAVANISGADNYTEDRKGNANSAIKFNGRYGLEIFKVPLTLNSTLAAWVKYDALSPSTNYFATSQWLMPNFAQDNDNYWGIVSTPVTSGVPSGPMDDNWHHLVATYDGKDVRFYVDGSFIGSSNNPCSIAIPQGSWVNYQVGYRTPQGSKIPTSVWYGRMDDLRFYARVLSAFDILTLYKQ
ncbi:MAG TPA: LamG domain-containing protein [Chitinophagaceae bacterium]|nr:LamG domain-containing protein [Chitinophagaceae bacterium]